ncbi:MAG: DUF4342 domain-containing protein [Eubacteriales bacterium]
MNTLSEKVNQLVKETNCSIDDAMEALEFCKGDYDEAYLYLVGPREDCSQKNKETYTVNGKDLLKTLKLLLKEGNITKIKIVKDKETLLNIPVNIVAIGSVLMPYAPIIATIAALVSDCQIEVERKGSVVMDVNSKFQKASYKVEEFMDHLINKF